MAPLGAPGGLPQPSASLQSKKGNKAAQTNIGRRSLQQEGPPEPLPLPLLPEPFAAEAPMTAPGVQ